MVESQPAVVIYRQFAFQIASGVAEFRGTESGLAKLRLNLLQTCILVNGTLFYIDWL
jgi:hypothetical protein